MLSALDIVFASVSPLWVDTVRNVSGPPAHRGYRMILHNTKDRRGDAAGGGGGGAGGKQGFNKQVIFAFCVL